MKSNISYFSSKNNIIAFKAAKSGVDIIIPSIPHRLPNIKSPNIIVTGCNLVVFDNITGCKKLPSKNWITQSTIKVNIPVRETRV